MKKCIIFIFLLLVSFSIIAQEKKETKPRILFILDASFSMHRKWGKEKMWDIARKTLGEYARDLDIKHRAEIGLRVYGHNFDIGMNNCKDTKLEVPIAPNNSPKIIEKLTYLKAQGTTPIAYSMSFAKEDFGGINNGKNTIILITDGEESCGGDPCAVSRALQESGVTLKPVVIGMDIQDFGVQKLKCIGTVSNSKTPEELKKSLNDALVNFLDKTTLQVHLLDSKNKSTETNVAMTFYQKGTKKQIQNLFHALDNRGNPDTIFLNNEFEFDMKVHTIPPIQKNNITLTQFKNNRIDIPASQGYINFQVKENTQKSKFDNTVKAIIRQNNKTVWVQDLNSTTKYLIGKYDIDILTLPRIKLKNIDVSDAKITDIKIESPGTLTLNKKYPVYGGLFSDEGTKLTKIYNIKNNISQESIAIQPGKYRLIYRAQSSKTMHNTIDKVIEIKSGTSISIEL